MSAFGVSYSVGQMSRPGVMTSDLIRGICVLKVSLWILTVLLNMINNAEGASEWIRKASVVLIKVSRERETDGTRGLGGSVMISVNRYANCGCQQKFTHIHTAGDVTV